MARLHSPQVTQYSLSRTKLRDTSRSDRRKYKFAIVVSRYNQMVTRRLLRGALSAFLRHGFSKKSVEIIWVPGAFEIPLAALHLSKSGEYDAVACLGCVLTGETSHNQYISQTVAYGIMKSSLLSGVPITFGVLTPNTIKQALARSGKNSANKGSEAAEAAIEMTSLLEKIG